MSPSYLHLKVILVLSIFIIGCSSTHPITSDLPQDNLASLTESDTFSNQAIMGLYEINIDTLNLNGSIEPIRSNMSNDTLEAVDITGFLSSSPCKDCLKIFSIGINSEGNLVLDMGIKHPFDIPDLSEPPTPRNRADLHVFNVEGIVLSDAPDIHNFPDYGITLATGNLLNPDGYTTYLDSFFDNIVPTLSKAHPFILHFDDFSNGNFDPSNPNGFTDILHPTGNLVMRMGSDYSIKQYEFNTVPGNKFSFFFAVGATYGLTAADFTERLNPEYRLPQHNKKAASKVTASIVASNLERGDTTSVATLRINVWDINHSATTGAGRNNMLFLSNVSSVAAYAPDISPEVKLSFPTPISGDGRNTPLAYEITITNVRNSLSGNQPCLIKVVDSYPAQMNPHSLLAGFDTMGRVDGTTNDYGQIPEMATYQYVELYVKPCVAPVLRTGVNTLDIGVDASGRPMIAYADNQVWRYDPDYCAGSRLYTVAFTDAGVLEKIAVHADGRSVILSDGCGG